MKPISQMSQIELAAFLHDQLMQQGIDVVLSGGSVVSYYSSDRYVSKDIDLIPVSLVTRKRLRQVLNTLGFQEEGRHFIHPDSAYVVEFPGGPLSLGEQPVSDIHEIDLETGSLRLLSATDCVKDRLCAYYFWNDHQGLEQAVLVAQHQTVDLEGIESWSRQEGHLSGFAKFRARLSSLA